MKWKNHALLAEVEREAANAAQGAGRGGAPAPWADRGDRLLDERGRRPSGRQLVYAGGGAGHLPRAAKRIRAEGVYLAAQCCEHLNRALIVEHEAVPNAEIVNVLPQPKAGSSFATAAYESFRHPVALEEIRADAGLDIGGTLIGMHLKKVAVPVRLKQDHIGQAIVLAARVRPNSSAASAPSTTRSSRTAIPISTQSNRKAPLSRVLFCCSFTSCGRSARRFPRRARACCRRAGRRAGSLSRSASPPRSGGSA